MPNTGELNQKETKEENALKANIKYVINALMERRSALKAASDTTTNPLDRLIFINKIEELDNIGSYLNSIIK